MADTGFLPKDKITTLIEALSKKQQVFVPTHEADVVRFKPYHAGATLCFDRPANIPPKDVIFPQKRCAFFI